MSSVRLLLSEMPKIKKCTENQTRNSYYYMRRLAVGLMLMDYAMVDKKNIGGRKDG